MFCIRRICIQRRYCREDQNTERSIKIRRNNNESIKIYDVQDLRYEDAPDPVIEKPDDVIVKVKAVGICGSDIARYRNLGPYVPGNVWGHEFCGEVVEVGEGVKNLNRETVS